VEAGSLREKLDRAGDVFAGFLDAPGLMGQYAVEVQRVRVLGLARQDLAVQSLRLFDVAGLMAIQGSRQTLRDLGGLLRTHRARGWARGVTALALAGGGAALAAHTTNSKLG
jgi:hypothetical protein